MRRTLFTILTIVPLLLAACDTKTKTVDACGDGFLDPGEACDGSQMSATTCTELGYYEQQGILTCRSDCTFELSVCTGGFCGDDIIQTGGGEDCDGDNLANMTCVGLSLGLGTLRCMDTCRWDTSGCEENAVCGDGTVASPYEQCEPENLNGESCLSRGFYGGDLACADDCRAFDEASCEAEGRCGDSMIQSAYGEVCEEGDLGEATCESLGYYGGEPACADDCLSVDVTGCEGRCGDGVVETAQGEECDGSAIGEGSCETEGFYEGALTCGDDCRYVTDGCHLFCGDGEIQTAYGEVCDGADLSGQTCVGLGHYGGELACAVDCRSLDESGCSGRCGDGIVNPTQGEECDGAAMGTGTCVTEGFYEGDLTCGSDCRYITSGCSGTCGDLMIQTAFGEDCEGADLNAQTCLTLNYGQASGALSCTTDCVFNEAACVPKSTNADLASLTVSAGTLTPAFSAATTTYSVTVTSSVTTLTVSATKADPYASLNLSPGQPMSLSPGPNSVMVTVMPESGPPKTTAVSITRLSPGDLISPYIGILRRVPAGTFQRDVTSTNLSTVSELRMGQHEVTRAQWTAVTGWADPSDVSHSTGIHDPVQQVSWYDAIAFCNKLSLAEGLTPVYSVTGVDFQTLTYAQIPAANSSVWNAATMNKAADGYRLPTEMEWMWAAMGADTTGVGTTNTTGYEKAFAGSTGSNLIGDYVWFSSNSSLLTHPAGTKLPNELALYDLSGNTNEWNWDWSTGYPSGALTDYSGPSSGTYRVSHGGSMANPATNCTVAFRFGLYPYMRSNLSGFRVVRN